VIPPPCLPEKGRRREDGNHSSYSRAFSEVSSRKVATTQRSAGERQGHTFYPVILSKFFIFDGITRELGNIDGLRVQVQEPPIVVNLIPTDETAELRTVVDGARLHFPDAHHVLGRPEIRKTENDFNVPSAEGFVISAAVLSAKSEKPASDSERFSASRSKPKWKTPSLLA
jgi:hypothetical protein